MLNKLGTFILFAGLGFLLGFIFQQSKVIDLQGRLFEATRPPKSPTRANWWIKPENASEYEVLRARRDWWRAILVEFIYPYVAPNTGNLMIVELLTPLNEQLVRMESQQVQETRMEVLRAILMSGEETDSELELETYTS
jgi:hypothetical protein